METTPLERDILSWIATHSGDDAISKQLADYKITSREFSGSGSFSKLKVSKGLPASSYTEAPCDPSIESPKLSAGGGCVLFLENGYVDMLEIFANGHSFPVHLEPYELKES